MRRLSIIFIFLSQFTYSHIEIFNLTKGTLSPNQPFIENYSFELLFQRNLFVDQIGIDFFNVGEDNVANLKLEIYNKDKIIFSKITLISDVYNQIAYIDLNLLLKKNEIYFFHLINLDTNDLGFTDNKIGLFSPNSLPYQEQSFAFVTKGIGSSSTTKYPYDASKNCPFIHIGTTSQTCSDFSKTSNSLEYNKFTSALFKSTSFKLANGYSSMNIDSIGLAYFDVGKDNISSISLKLIDSITGESLWMLDTTLIDIHKVPIKFPVEVKLKSGVYLISLEMLDSNNIDDNIVLYKPINLPYIDNLNIFTINSISSTFGNSQYWSDTIAIPFLFSTYLDELQTSVTKINSLNLVYCENKIIIRTATNQLTGNVELFGLDGVNVYFTNPIQINEKEYIIDTSEISKGFYILKISENRFNDFSQIIQIY
jgi:hypothetical protein